MYFSTISAILFGVLIFTSPSFETKGNFSFLDLPAKNQNSQNLFLEQGASNQIEFPDLALIQESGLKAVSPPNIFRSEVLGTLAEEPEEKREITEYIAKEGDSVWSIAKSFGISTETIISANNIKNNLVKSGQRLLILPLDGVIHLVKEGDTVTDLAKKYKVEAKEIISFNKLSEDGDLFLDELLIIPGGKMPAEPKAVNKVKLVGASGKKHYYPWGWCTWWVEEKRPVPTSWGNAKNWLDRAIVSGLDVCKGSSCAPEPGAIISLKTSNSLGHVAYVEEVKGDTVIFSEMNYYQFGEMNYRRLKIGDSLIKGYIY